MDLTNNEASKYSAYSSLRMLRERLSRSECGLSGVEFKFTDSYTNRTLAKSTGTSLIEIGVNFAKSPQASFGIEKLSSALVKNGFVESKKDGMEIATHLYEMFLIMHEIGHANANALHPIKKEDSLYGRIYQESYADAFAAGYLGAAGLPKEVLLLLTQSVAHDFRIRDEKLFKEAYLTKNPLVSGREDFAHNTGLVLERMGRLVTGETLSGVRLQEAIKREALNRRDEAFHDPVYASMEPTTLMGQEQFRRRLLSLDDVCTNTPNRPVDVGGFRSRLMDCGSTRIPLSKDSHHAHERTIQP